MDTEIIGGIESVTYQEEGKEAGRNHVSGEMMNTR